MAWTYYTTTEGTGTTHYNRFDYYNSTTSTASTYVPWNSYTNVQHTIGTYITGQDSYYDQYNRRYLEPYGLGTYVPYQQESRAPRQEPEPPKLPQKTPEQLRIEAEAKKAEADAKERAKTLLLEYLDNENRQRLLDNKPLEIASKLFKNIKYQIPISKMDKIIALKENKVVTRLCLLVREHETLPVEDVVLTKLLHVLNDERTMLKTANHSGVQENLLAGLN